MTSTFGLLRDGRRGRRHGPDALAMRQRERLASMVAFGHTHSPYQRQLCRTVPDRVQGPALLLVTHKQTLMAHFDNWVTDREATIDRVRAFVADPEWVGERFPGRYLVLITSGTTGHRGVLLLEDRAAAVVGPLPLRATTAPSPPPRRHGCSPAGRGRRTSSPRAAISPLAPLWPAPAGRLHARRSRVLSVHSPLPALVDQLNWDQPVFLGGCANMIALLAGGQLAGRLHIAPAVVSLDRKSVV